MSVRVFDLFILFLFPALVYCHTIQSLPQRADLQGTRGTGRSLRQDDITADRLYRKQVDFEGDGKVLLSRLGDKIHATSAFCTHYGAPLVKGVLTADGRVVWCADSPISRAAQD